MRNLKSIICLYAMLCRIIYSNIQMFIQLTTHLACIALQDWLSAPYMGHVKQNSSWLVAVCMVLLHMPISKTLLYYVCMSKLVCSPMLCVLTDILYMLQEMFIAGHSRKLLRIGHRNSLQFKLSYSCCCIFRYLNYLYFYFQTINEILSLNYIVTKSSVMKS